MKNFLVRGGGAGGFTLVELLIVIALLGAIALIVIAAINPIEQANRARDTRLKSDSGQIISAIDRYFASQGKMPWASTTDVAPSLAAVDAGTPAIGICDNDTDATNNAGSTSDITCTQSGNLIRNDELKSEFRNRDFVKPTTIAANRLFMLKGSGASSSVYACFIPLSNSERSKTGSLRNLVIDSGSNAPQTGCTTTNWTTSPCYICIPE